ncbi:acetylxylan esterase [Clostridium baratii]|uniref:acetylxylan esterase n=1 Tax=Clostridium baratii TaxID=1561 RepID=UPI00097FB49F|nr:acetylxylan esterase [Clostridium baratii]AQM59284.1 acetylesterase [Clostridium baratii]
MPMIDMPLEKLYEYSGISPSPKDLDEFWDENIKSLEDIELNVEIVESEFKCPFAKCYHLYFTGTNGARIHAKFIKPNKIEGKIPALLEFHGYQGGSFDWSSKLVYAANGMCVAALDCRGQAGLSQDVGGTLGITVKGHIVRGLQEGRDKLLYKDIFLDTAILAKIIMNLDFVDENRVGTMGGSQGGALALACAALEPRIKKVFAFYPFLCDFKRVWKMDLGGEAYDELKRYFKFIDPAHETEDYVFNTLAYIDIQNLAHRIKAKVTMLTGLMDNICPPSTQFAAYNKINSSKDIIVFPEWGHESISYGLNDRIYKWSVTI